MQDFHPLFGPQLQLEYDCFDRIVLNGYLSFMTRENNVVYFFRDVCGITPITKDALGQRTREYQQWVERYAANHKLPCEWMDERRNEAIVATALKSMERRRQTGVYYILKSMEQGDTYRIFDPRYAAADPNYRILRRMRSRYTHYYFYIRDEVAGPFALRVGSFLPFPVSAYLNGHSFIARALEAEGIAYRKDDNRFLAVADPAALQRSADQLEARTIQQRIEYWLHILGPKFTPRERERCSGLHRFWSMRQVEYCRNFVFKRAFPLRELFERSCELGLYLLTADRLVNILGQQVRRHIRGKLDPVLERVEHGFFVFRAHWKQSFLKQYMKCHRFLRNEVVSNNLKNFTLKKGLANLEAVRQRFKSVTARYAEFQAQTLNVHGQLDLLSQLSKTVTVGKSRIAGIKLENERIQRVIEVLLRQGHSLPAWSSRQLHQAVCDTFGLDPKAYSRHQLRYDLRKLKAHGLLERDGRRYAYRLSEKGTKAAVMMTLFRKRIYGPMAAGTMSHRPDPAYMPDSRFERLYHRIDRDIDSLLSLLAA